MSDCRRLPRKIEVGSIQLDLPCEACSIERAIMGDGIEMIVTKRQPCRPRAVRSSLMPKRANQLWGRDRRVIGCRRT